DSTTSATFCLYCKSPAIIKNRFAGRFKPKSVIPFQLTKEQAKIIYKKWMNRRILAPDEFKQKEEIEKVTGIYAPFWLFDCKVEGSISGDAKQTTTWRSGDYNYIKTRYFHFARNGHASYNRIPVDASKKLDDKFMHMIEPFDYTAMTDFSMKYMSGFMAEKYDVEASEAEVVLKQRAEEYLEGRLRGTVDGYSTYTVNNKLFSLSDIASSYSMLPIYLMINKFKGKDHVFIVNGQTGKVVGDTPLSLLKQITFFLGVFIIAMIIGFLGGALFV
ncbi:MAG: DNA helicase PriA, partial [Clostridiaceae bacterium]|nr:DNA helicase PriA [Clostridiaceae bacterium]